MNPKDFLTNKSFCPLPWTGFHLEPTGKIKNCVLSHDEIGDLKENSIGEILSGEKNLSIKEGMLANQKPSSCASCYKLEQNKNSFDIISSRIYYLKELKNNRMETFDVDNFNLQHVDVRWQNTCNFACVYCGPDFSSKWERELNVEMKKVDNERKQQFKNYIFENISNLKNVYLAGGEPLLMTDNEEFLALLLEKNPNVTLRVNTNLSKTNTKVFGLINQFKNVHWTLSVETIGEEFEYIRYGGKWADFLENLEIIKNNNHKISFNMLWFVLNYKSIFNCVDFFMSKGFHPNSFILGPILSPVELDVRNLPQETLDDLKSILTTRIDLNYDFFLQDGYINLLKHLSTPFEKDIDKTFNFLAELDLRRNLDSTKVFKELYQEGQNYGKTV